MRLSLASPHVTCELARSATERSFWPGIGFFIKEDSTRKGGTVQLRTSESGCGAQVPPPGSNSLWSCLLVSASPVKTVTKRRRLPERVVVSLKQQLAWVESTRPTRRGTMPMARGGTPTFAATRRGATARRSTSQSREYRHASVRPAQCSPATGTPGTVGTRWALRTRRSTTKAMVGGSVGKAEAGSRSSRLAISCRCRRPSKWRCALHRAPCAVHRAPCTVSTHAGICAASACVRTCQHAQIPTPTPRTCQVLA